MFIHTQLLHIVVIINIFSVEWFNRKIHTNTATQKTNTSTTTIYDTTVKTLPARSTVELVRTQANRYMSSYMFSRFVCKYTITALTTRWPRFKRSTYSASGVVKRNKPNSSKSLTTKMAQVLPTPFRSRVIFSSLPGYLGSVFLIH